jgi:YidC/Oxa1 family membrane protein insertase
MERRLLIAFALSFLVIMVSRSLWEPRKSSAPLPQNERTRQEGVKEEKAPPVTNVVPIVEGPSENKRADTEKLVQVETDLYQLTFSNKEAVVRSWILKKYRDNNGKPLDLVDEKKAKLFGYPLGLTIDREEEASKSLAQALFTSESPSKIDLTSSSGNSSQQIEFEFSDQNLHVLKKLTFNRGSYTVQVDCKVWMRGKPANYYLLWRSWSGDSTLDERTTVRTAVYHNGQKVTRLKASQLETEQELSGSFDFVGVEDQYFAAVLFPTSTVPIKRIQIGRDENKLESGKNEFLLRSGAYIGGQEQVSLNVFVGPKDTGVLEAGGHNLISLIDYGWFGVVSKPLFVALKAIYSLVRNYGLAIIILTVLINIALFPLRYKSIISAQKMQRLQPQMKAIQEKYKKLKPTDPKRQQMNTEVMALYKEHGVNPVGGCLPLLLQMPFFIAFYNLLSVSIELRHAPFVLWITDLSQYDHTFILPILMTVSMVVMQKMTPSPTADPVQAKMMLAMPLVFGFMLAFTSSGLVLYWLTSNLVGILQQHFMNKHLLSSTKHSSKAGKKK